MKDIKKIIDIISNHVELMNSAKDYAECESMERYRNELTGMIVILKNVDTSGRFYGINYYESGYEFGYYSNDRWHHITGPYK